MRNSRNRSTVLCLDECISSYSWDIQNGISCVVSFGFEEEGGTFHKSPQASESYTIAGDDYKELMEIIDREGFKLDLLWPYIDRVRNKINSARKVVIDASPNS